MGARADEKARAESSAARGVCSAARQNKKNRKIGKADPTHEGAGARVRFPSVTFNDVLEVEPGKFLDAREKVPHDANGKNHERQHNHKDTLVSHLGDLIV